MTFFVLPVLPTLASLAWADDPAPPSPLPLPEDPALHEEPILNRIRFTPHARLSFSGFRLQLPAGRPALSARLALVADPIGLGIGELTLRGQAGWTWFAVDAEVVVAGAVADEWSRKGFGNARFNAAIVFGPAEATNTLGVQVTVPRPWYEGADTISFWGSVPEATIGAPGASIVYSGTTGALGWHLQTGLRDARSGNSAAFTPIDLEAMIAYEAPLVPGWALVTEAEAALGASPFQLRVLARGTPGRGWTADVGLVAPIPSIFTAPSLQVVSQVARRF